MGTLVVNRGELWWGETPDAKGRPYLVVSRSAANEVMRSVLVAPITSRVRGVPSELPVGAAEGLPIESVATFDNVQALTKALLTRRLGELGRSRQRELCDVIRSTFDC